MVVPPQRAACGQGGAVGAPRSRERMAQEMGALAGGSAPGPRQGAAHERPDTLAVGASTGWGPHPDKDLPRRARWSPVAEGGDERGAPRMRQREAIRAGSLPPAPECSGVPIQSIQGQGHHCTGPSTEPGQQEHKRVIAAPVRCAPVTALSQACDILSWHTLGEGCQPPVGDGGHRCGPIVGDDAALEDTAAKTPACGRDDLGVRGALTARLLYHDVADVLGTERLQPESLGATSMVEKTPDGVAGGLHRRGGHATLLAQGVLQVAGDAIARARADVGHRAGHHAVLVEVREQSPSGRTVMTVGTTAPRAVLEKVGNALVVAIHAREGLGLEPAAEVGEEAHHGLRRPTRVALGE